MDEFSIRPIEPRDDRAMAAIIREVMTEHGACGPGFSIHDPEVDHMCAAYAGPRAAYWVVERAGEVVGGGGIAPLKDAGEDTCELQKMYYRPVARGRGLGRRLLELCLAEARRQGYRTVYLETLGSMEAAGRLYEKAGFRPIDGPMGCTGHGSCDRYYTLELEPAEEA